MYAYLRKELGVRFKGTSDDISRHDSYIYKDEKLIAIGEAKCRDMTEAALKSYGNTWLITNDKIIACLETAKKKEVPFIGLLYLVPDAVICLLKISDERGKPVIEYEVRESWTQTTVNNLNKIKRANAYFPMETSARVRMDKKWIKEYRKRLKDEKKR